MIFFLFRTDVHSSTSDSQPHWTVDAYGVDENSVDKPIGTIHVYEDGSVGPYRHPRSKAKEVWLRCSPTSIANDAKVI